MPILDVEDLCVEFQTRHGSVHAVDGVSFSLEAGETLGLVGESGSGKSVTNLALLGLIPSPPGLVSAGRMEFAGRDLLKLQEREWRKVRGAEIAMIFQDPMTALNPLLTIGRQLLEVFEVHGRGPRRDSKRRAIESLGEVGIPEPEKRLKQYPHELSGGMRQRVMIAMAMLLDPRVLLADEPTTALDVTIQAQILDLIADLQKHHGTAVILVTHDLGVVAGMADRVNVMYAGRLVETGRTDPIYETPAHPYTRGLLDSVPSIDVATELAGGIDGQPPDLADLPPGCAFAPRCDLRGSRCTEEKPRLDEWSDRVDGEHLAACFFGGERATYATGSTTEVAVARESTVSRTLSNDAHEAAATTASGLPILPNPLMPNTESPDSKAQETNAPDPNAPDPNAPDGTGPEDGGPAGPNLRGTIEGGGAS